MALRKGSIALRFQGGIETKMDGKAVPAAKLLALENAVFSKAVSLVKRNGYDALPTAVLGSAVAYEDAQALAARGTELLLFANNRCYSYVDGASGWNDAGAVMSVTQSDRAIAKAPATQTLGDYAAAGGIGVAAWEDSRGGVYWCAVEDDGGRIVHPVTQASSTGTRPRCVRVGSKLAVIWAEAAQQQLKIIILDPAQPHTYNSSIFPSVLVADLVTAEPHFDAEYVPESPYGTAAEVFDCAVIAWNAVDGVRIGYLHPSGQIGGPGLGMPSVLTVAHDSSATSQAVTISVNPFRTDYLAVVNVDGQVMVRVIRGTTASLSVLETGSAYGGARDRVAAAWRHADSNFVIDVYMEERSSPLRNSQVHRHAKVVGGSGSADGGTWRGACLASKAFTVDGNRAVTAADAGAGGSGPSSSGLVQGTDPESDSFTFVHVVHDVPLFGVYLCMRNDGIVIARTMPGIAGDAPGKEHLPSVIDDGEGGSIHRWVAGAKAQLDGIDGDVFTEQGLRLVALDFDHDDAYQTSQIGASLYLGGACPQLYDGQGWVEHNFHYGIDWETTETLWSEGSGGGGGLDAGTYSYIVVPEFTLANGEIVMGPPSKPMEVTITGSNDKVTLTIPTVRITRMTAQSSLAGLQRGEVRIGVYRSQDGDATVYYRCSSLDPAATGNNGYVANVTTADSVSFVDVMSDANLIKKEPLYTSGGILENDPIAGAGVLAGGKGRLFTTDPSDGNLVLFSQERRDGYAMEMPAGLAVRVDDVGGAITALGVMDDAIVIFKRGAVYVVRGPGPLANPDLGGGFTAPQRVPGDVGCTAPKSVVGTPLGLMFQSAKGIYLLDRGYGLSYVGAPVEQYNGTEIVRATLVDDTHQVRFLTSSGVTLLYDTLFGQWSTFTNHKGLDAAIVDGAYHYLRTDGRVFVETSAEYADGDSQIPYVLETAWIHLQQHLQGLQKIWTATLLGTWKSAHTLRVQYQLDYQVGWSAPFDIDATSMGGTVYGEGVYGDGPYGGTSPAIYQHKIHLGRTCQAIRFRFSFLEAAGAAGACAELTELLLTGGVKRAEFTVAPARST